MKKYEKMLTAGIRRVSGSFSETEQMSGFFRNSSSKKPNVLTPPPLDLGMLRRPRRVLIFPMSMCIIYFDF